MNDPRWGDVKKVCARSLIANHCPNYTKEFHAFQNENPSLVTIKDNYGTQQEDHVKFVNRHMEYEQRHSSVHDVLYLIRILQCVAKKDGCPLDGGDHIEKVENVLYIPDETTEVQQRPLSNQWRGDKPPKYGGSFARAL